MKMLKQEDYIAAIIEDLGLVKKEGRKAKYRMAKFMCELCNKPFVIAVFNAQRSKTGYCQHCTATTKGLSHKLSRTTLYKVWASIKDRCYNKNSPLYKRYGALGVTMSDEWKKDFTKFKDWADENNWEKSLHIDKDIKSRELGLSIPIYSKETCSVVTAVVNQREKSMCRELPYYIYKEKENTENLVVRVKNGKNLKYIGTYDSLSTAIAIRDLYMKENNLVY